MRNTSPWTLLMPSGGLTSFTVPDRRSAFSFAACCSNSYARLLMARVALGTTRERTNPQDIAVTAFRVDFMASSLGELSGRIGGCDSEHFDSRHCPKPFSKQIPKIPIIMKMTDCPVIKRVN